MVGSCSNILSYRQQSPPSWPIRRRCGNGSQNVSKYLHYPRRCIEMHQGRRVSQKDIYEQKLPHWRSFFRCRWSFIGHANHDANDRDAVPGLQCMRALWTDYTQNMAISGRRPLLPWCSCWLAYLRPPLLKSINDDAKLYFFHSRTAYCRATFRVVYLGFDLLDEGDCYCHTLPWGAARNCKTMSALGGLDFMSSLVVRNNNNSDSSTVWEASPVHGDRQAGRSDKRSVYR